MAPVVLPLPPVDGPPGTVGSALGVDLVLQRLAPGANAGALDGSLPVAAIAIEGSGKLLIDGAPLRFQAPCALLFPDGSVCRITNVGAEPLPLVWVLRREPP